MLGPPDRDISGYGGQRLKVTGACKITCRNINETAMLVFDIVFVKYARPLLCLRACLDLVKLVHTVEVQPGTHTSIATEFADVFKGIGPFPGECVLHLKP